MGILRKCIVVLLIICGSCKSSKKVETDTTFTYLNNHFEENETWIKETVLVKNPSKNEDTLKIQLLNYQGAHGKQKMETLIKNRDKNYIMRFYYNTPNTAGFVGVKHPDYLNNIYIYDYVDSDYLGTIYFKKCNKGENKWFGGVYLELRDENSKVVNKEDSLFINECEDDGNIKV